MQRALEMPDEERHRRATALREVIAADDIIQWLSRQFGDLLDLG